MSATTSAATNDIHIELADCFDVSFVIIAFNEADNIRHCLDSIRGQRGLSESYEIIVVDDGSTDSTAAVVGAYSEIDPRVRLAGDGTNHGRGAARAVGVANARGALVAMVDGDIRLPEHWLETCAGQLAQIDGVGGLAVPDGDVAFVHRALRLPAKPRPGSTTITGNNGLFRRFVFDRVTYDAGLRNGEDVEFNQRATAAGLTFETMPALMVEHCESKGYITSLQWLFESGSGAARQLERTREVRLPDIAFVIWTACVAAATIGAGHSRRPRWLALPLFATGAIAAVHHGQRFTPSRKNLARYGFGWVVDTSLVGAYLVGRCAGHLRSGAGVLRSQRVGSPLAEGSG